MTKEQDKQIAEKVMGWELFYEPGSNIEPYWIDKELVTIGHQDDFNPTTDANDDHLVLKHIRENWGGGRLWLFDGSLVSGWVKGSPNERQIELPKYYEPGDYSLAALRVLSGEIAG